MSHPGEIEIARDDSLNAPGLESLVAEAWAECGRKGSMPSGWRPFSGFQAIAFEARRDRRLEGYCVVRPAEGMDSIDFFYVRKKARGSPVHGLLLARAVEELRRIGQSGIIYCGYTWWRGPFPDSLAQGFREARFGRFEGVFLGRPLEPGGPPEPPLPPGVELADWEDARFDEVCEMMCRTPEPGALYWDLGLCRRSIRAAGNPLPPLFRDGLGQLALRTGEAAPGAGGAGKRVVGFSLSTSLGYINHVYTDPAEQGKGIASALIARVLRAQARLGIQKATILTHETNPRAIAVYRKLGFEVEFTFPQFYVRHGQGG
jgi:ribosomal protein S18 acetylase RimI-like enzyme